MNARECDSVCVCVCVGACPRGARVCVSCVVDWEVVGECFISENLIACQQGDLFPAQDDTPSTQLGRCRRCRCWTKGKASAFSCPDTWSANPVGFMTQFGTSLRVEESPFLGKPPGTGKERRELSDMGPKFYPGRPGIELGSQR